MKKLNLIKTGIAVAALLLCSFSAGSVTAPPEKQQYYEIRIYHITGPAQESRVDAFLKSAYLPALHRAGIPKAGVFKPIERDTAFGKLIYVFVPFKTIDDFLKLGETLSKDQAYNQAGKDFLDAPFNDPPYRRQECILLKAFALMPAFRAPNYTNPASERIYELRSYESATEAKAAKKIQMFNEGGEIRLFESLSFNAVFYGQVLTGSHMPNLMYMTTFQDMTTHDAKWKSFSSSPEWKKLSGMDEYKNTVSKANPYLLHPTDYSDF
ncbi:MAG: NIPSNAP family protein [Bacteroidales bacterium]